ncbi:MAG: MotA/TolQ/ExbB proton channel family protein [Lachnospiraceae bacterium]|nr:MotA/TolQ/ExbB proton channel family protein [Lachnospiraceae bacterium]
MRKEGIVAGLAFVIAGGLLLSFAQDDLSLIFVIIMSVILILGYATGIVGAMRYSRAFIKAKKSIDRVKMVQTSSIWLAVQQLDEFFGTDDLDELFKEYRIKTNKNQKERYAIMPGIETVISEEYIELKTWHGIVTQIPSTMTGLGILGTFVGLIMGISNIGFSSVNVAISSLQTLIEGVSIAFYTSIAGMILSLMFNLTYKYIWGIMLRDLYSFYHEFHRFVIPTEEEQKQNLQSMFYQDILEKINLKQAEDNIAQD